MGEGRLVVEIKNRVPVELVDLNRSLLAIADEYQTFADESFDGAYRTEAKLYVHEIRTGSIITELVPIAAGLLPFLTDANNVLAFTERLRKLIDWLRNPSGKEGEAPSFERKSLENVNSILEPVAKDSGSQLNISCSKIENHGPVVINIDSRDANAIQNQVRRQLSLMRAPDVGRHDRALMYWYQARNDLSSAAGDRAIIESISPRPVKVTFLSESTKGQMLRAEENPFKFAFIVDVDIETVNGKPALYKILCCHDRIEKPA